MIVTDENALRMDCVDSSEAEALDIIEKLESALLFSEKKGMPGIGLAAPQIGLAKNVAIIRIGDIKINLVNCHIDKMYDKFLFEGEGCLSFPGRFETTWRYNEVHIISNMFRPHSFIVTGLAAVACQHELDHLNKKLLPDVAISKQAIAL